MQKQCGQCSTSFEITDEDLAFYEKVSPVFNGKKYHIPPPTHCPDCRIQRKLASRNERVFYNRKCDLCNKSIISIYAEDAAFPVYCGDCWWSDKWDPMAYGQQVDMNASIFEQFLQLQNNVPRLYFVSKNCENSEYCNQADDLKNCYLIIGSKDAQDCLYGYRFQRCKNCLDGHFIDKCELCYECIDCYECYNVFYGQNCKNVHDARWVTDCLASNNLLFCAGLRSAQYCILNEQYEKSDFQNKREEILSSPKKIAEYQQRFQELQLRTPVRSMIANLAENCTGNYITECQNIQYAFDIKQSRDAKFICDTWMINDSYDVFSFYGPGELNYEILSAGMGFFHCLFTKNSWPCTEVLYCDHCFNCQHCFGCSNLQKKEYCIFNKQYSKEEYEHIVPQLIENMKEHREWGEFFPIAISPFSYNETVAHEYYPLSQKEVEQKGWSWKQRQDGIPDVEKVIPAKKLPENIDDIPDDILNWAIECEATGRPFRIMKTELNFYRSHRLPIPHFHPDERHRRRMLRKNPRKLWARKCGKCQKDMQTTYAPDRPEIVYCEKCYLETVY